MNKLETGVSHGSSAIDKRFIDALSAADHPERHLMMESDILPCTFWADRVPQVSVEARRVLAF